MLNEIRPQPGPQEKFLSTSADIAIYGGAAGGGKTFALLTEGLRHVGNPLFGFVIFRRNSTQIRNEGGLWDESMDLYPAARGVPHETFLEWKFPSGAKGKFAHLDHDKTRFSWDGSQITYIGFDELHHFSRIQFFYMLSRNRSTSGIRPYIRATCNPDPDSWVKTFISWWIDDDTGYAIRSRGGVVRHFIMVNNDLIWADTANDLVEKYAPEEWKDKPGDPGNPIQPKSVTFIPASVHDNQILMGKDPGYLANLNALPLVERERLKSGNWKVRQSVGAYFKREDFEVVDDCPASAVRVRYWDRASTEKTSDNNPDWTAGCRMAKDRIGIFYVEDMRRFQEKPHRVETKIKNTATTDGRKVEIGIEQDPGAAGKFEADYYVRQLAGYIVKAHPVSKNKLARARPASSQAGAGNIKVVRGSWNDDFFNEIEHFTGDSAGHDDQVDAFSGAFNVLANRTINNTIASAGRRRFI